MSTACPTSVATWALSDNFEVDGPEQDDPPASPTGAERMFNRLKPFRCIATGYDKTAASFPAFPGPASATVWQPAFVHRAQTRHLSCFH